jgi:hypothetical protein
MKNNTKILAGFMIIIVLIFVQAVIAYKLQGDILANTEQIKNVEAPLGTMSEQVIGYDGILTAEAYAIVLHREKGDVVEIKEHRARYDEIGIKLDELLKKDAKILITQSRRSQEEKEKALEYIKNLNDLNLKLVDLETRAFESAEKGDTETAYALVIGEDYHKYKQELYQEYRAWANSEHEITLNISNNIIKKSQQMSYLCFGISIVILIITILTMLRIRSFVAEKYKLLYETSKEAIMTLEPPKWKFTSGNPAAIKLFDVKDEKQFISLTPKDLSPEKQPDGQLSSLKSKKMIEQAMKQGSAFFKWTHKKYKGKSFSANVLLSRVEDNGKVYLQATVRELN